jgi:hypothetical protein
MLCIILCLFACSTQPSVSFDTLEEARGTARDNALYNAQMFRQQNVQFSDWSVESRGDSSQTNDCPNGDGWSTMKFVSPDKRQVMNVKCSTVSVNVNCMPEEEFRGKPMAAEDGHCQSRDKVPFPLPKLSK